MRKNMKRVAAIALSATLALTVTAPVASAEDNWGKVKKSYTRYIKQNVEASEVPTMKKYVDIDQDGVKECIYIECYNRCGVTILTYKDGKVVQAGEDIGGVTAVNYSKKNKQLVVQTADSAFESGLQIYELTGTECELVKNFSIVWEDGENREITDVLTGEKVDEKTYNKYEKLTKSKKVL